MTVVGAGPAGAAVALALRARGVSVLLVERSNAPEWKIGETLPPAANPLLRQLGVADLVCKGALPSFANASAWGSTTPVENDFILQRHGLGWQLDRAGFEKSLMDAAAREGAAVWKGTSFAGAEPGSTDMWRVRLICRGEKQVVKSRWLIDATGRKRVIARWAGEKVLRADSLVCVYAIASRAMGVPPDQDTRTFVESSPHGWWYTALTPGGRRTVAFFCDPAYLLNHQWRKLGWLLSQISSTKHLRRILGDSGYELWTPARCTSANSTCLCRSIGRAWLAVGDATIAFDPLSSQGLFHGLSTAIAAANGLADYLRTGSTVGLLQYSTMLHQVWTAYLTNRQAYYQMEGRWSEHDFWRHRQVQAASDAMARRIQWH